MDMEWYAIAGTPTLTVGSLVNELSRAGISCTETHVAEPIGSACMAFRKEHMEQFLKLTGLKVEELTEVPTDRDIITLLEMSEATSNRLVDERHKRNYIALCRDRRERAMRQAERDRDNARNTITAAQKQIVVNVQKEADAVRDIARHKRAIGSNSIQMLTDEYEKIMQMPGVRSIQFDPGNSRLSIDTELIEIPYGDYVFEIGEFRIDVRLNDGNVRFYNETNARGKQHPHIGSGGEPCWGELDPAEVARLVATQEFPVLIQFLLSFLESYNPRDPWVPIERWASETWSGEEEED